MYPAESDPGPFPIPSNAPIENWPLAHNEDTGALPKPGRDAASSSNATGTGDRHLIVVDPVNRPPARVLAGAADRHRMGGVAGLDVRPRRRTRCGPNGWTSSDAAGLPIFPSIVRYDEVARGVVAHAMRVTVRRTRRAYVYPARHFASRATDPACRGWESGCGCARDFDTSAVSAARASDSRGAEAIRHVRRRQRGRLADVDLTGSTAAGPRDAGAREGLRFRGDRPDGTGRGPTRQALARLAHRRPHTRAEVQSTFAVADEQVDPTSSPQGALPPRIGHYAIERKLGEGGMGIVYAARDERLERTVALKTMAALANDQTARQRFWREARAAASVNHPNVCQIYEIGEEDGELFIAMELLEGEVLAERLRRGPLSASEAMPLALGMLAALSALHARGIIHRDLKPSNVFLTPHGVKLLDFGLALSSVGTPLDATIGQTRTGMVLGTPRYMAPEQVTGETVDARSDLFATGAILFEMLAGRPAFGGRTIVRSHPRHAATSSHQP